MNTFESWIERLLWRSRLVIVIPVVFSMLLALGVLLLNTVDSINVIGQFLAYLNPALAADARDALRLEVISKVVGIIDGYLISAILFIFAMGLYELFVGKIELLEGSEFAARMLLFRSLDDLKDRLANMIVVILIVKFFQQALEIKYKSPLDLLALAVGIVLLGGALYLTGRTKLIKKENSATK